MRVWANAWDVFRRTPFRGGRGRRPTVDLFRGVFLSSGISCGVFRFLYFERTRPAGSTYEAPLPHLPLLVGITEHCPVRAGHRQPFPCEYFV